MPRRMRVETDSGAGSRASAREREHQLVQAPDECGRIFQLSTLGEQRLIEQDEAPVREARLLALRAQALHQRVMRVDLEDRLGGSGLLPRSLEQTLEVHAHAILIGNQARRRAGEAMRDANLLHLLAERRLNACGEILEFVRLLFLLFLLRLVLELAQV